MNRLHLFAVILALAAWLGCSMVFLGSSFHPVSIPMVIVLYAVAVFFAGLAVWLLEKPEPRHF